MTDLVLRIGVMVRRPNQSTGAQEQGADERGRALVDGRARPTPWNDQVMACLRLFARGQLQACGG